MSKIFRRFTAGIVALSLLIVSLPLTAADTDTTSPMATTFFPLDDATNVAVNINFTITFDEDVKAGSGNIVIKKSADDLAVATIDVSSNEVLFNELDKDKVTIDPTADLLDSTSYYFEIDAGAITDLVGNPYAGISSKTIWNFTTVAGENVDNTIALASGWNVFSTPRVFESINFSNKGTGVSFYKMEGGEWSNTTTPATITNIQPLEGFFINNTSGDTVYVYLDYENSNPGEQLFAKTLDAGWNIVGVADLSFQANDEDYTEISVKNAFSSVKDQPSNIIDYTTDNFAGNDNSNEIDSLAPSQRYSTPETDTEKFEEFKAYPVFIRQRVVYSGSSTNKSDSPSPPPPAEINGSLTVTKSSTPVSDTYGHSEKHHS